MHAPSIVARILGSCLERLHAKQAQALQRAVMGLLLGGVASLSAIGLHLPAGTRFKHRLKSVDRLLSNAALHGQREALYAQLSCGWLSGLSQVLLVVDWSDLTRDQRFHWLRASVVVQGRSMTLYEEVHPQARLSNPGVHQRFLARLGKILPPGCRPIVLTDAGFHAPWFKLVAACGWDFIGRLRGRNLVRVGEEDWQEVRHTFGRAGKVALDLGPGAYARRNAVAVRLVLAKRPAKGRHRLRLNGKRATSRSSLKHGRSASEPWLLASSLGLQHLEARTIVALYAQRMRIEESFRDTKNVRWGLGLDSARSRNAKRLEMLLLLAHLVGFIERLIGESAKQAQLELDFSSTKRRRRPEISVITLARRILDTMSPVLERLRPWQALPLLTAQAANACLVT